MILSRLPTHERRLDNGLTVLVREDHSAPVVGIVTHVKAGYFNEPDRVVGISHVLEHMYFKGTERLGPGEIARRTKGAGGFLNAGTIYDYTSYYTVLPASALELGLEVQSDALRNSAIDPDELARELQVIIQEAKRKLDNPAAVARETLYELLFDVHRIRRWRIGTEEALERITREDVWRYYQELYRPSNVILVVAGDVDPASTFERIERYYGGMPGGEPVGEPSPEEPERVGARFREMAGDVVHTHAEWGWRTPGSLHDDTPALDLLSTVLGQGRASRLYRHVREAGWVTAIGAYNYTPTELGIFGVGAELLPADTRAAVEAVWREVVRLRETEVAPAALERAKNILEAYMVRRTETVQGQANLLAEWQALGDWRLGDRYLERLLAVEAAELRRVAGDYLTRERTGLLLYRPEGSAPIGWEADELDGILAAVEREGAAAAAPPPTPPTPPSVPRRGGVAAAAQGVRDEVWFYEMTNGVRFAIKPRRGSPLVSMGIFARGGTVHESPEEAGRTRLVARVSVKGTRTRTAVQIAEATEALGGAVGPVVGSDLFAWTLSLPSRHFASGFSLLADVALRPSFPEAELERERRIALSDLDQLRDDMYRYPMRLFLQGAFPDHPYGFTTAALEASLRAADPEALRRWHRQEVLDARPWVLVVGDVDPDAAATLITRELEEVDGTAERDGARAPSWPEGPLETAEHRAKAQTALVLGFPGPARGEDDFYTLQVLANAVSGLGGRLFEELRSRRSLAYTVNASPMARRLGGAFVAYIATAPEREDEARRGLLEELDRLTEETLDPEELARAQEYTVGAWKIRNQTNGAQLSDLAYALLLGEGLAELREFERRIRAVTPVAAREAARRWFDPDRLVEGIVRGTGVSR